MKPKSSRYINRNGFCAIAAIVCFIVAIIFRIIGEFSNIGDPTSLIFELILPAACCLLYILCIVCFSRKGFWTSFIPVCLGATFFIEHVVLNGGSEALPLSAEFTPIYMSVCILVFVFAASLYTATVTGGIRTKWIMIIFLALGLAFQIVFRVYPAIVNGADIETVLTLLSVTCMILGLGFATVGLRRLYIAKPDAESPAVIPPVPGQQLAGAMPVPSAAREESEIIPAVVNDVKPEIEPVIINAEGPTAVSDENKACDEPERTPAEVPVSFGEKVKGWFTSRKSDPPVEPAINNPSMDNVMGAIESDLSEESEDTEDTTETAPEAEGTEEAPEMPPESDENKKVTDEEKDDF